MKLRRWLHRLLSEGQGRQLFWLAIVLLLSFFVFFGISTFIFRDGAFRWQDIVALYLDPGVFEGALDNHDVFRLIITLFGAFFFAAMLISVVSNIFENVSESYKKGEGRYRFEDHVLILGANHMLFGMLAKLREKMKTQEDLQVVVMTTRPVEELRDRIEAYFGDKDFVKHVTLYFDERDQRENLKSADADRASAVYVIGEEGEDNHDAVNLKCLEALRALCRDSKYLKKNPSHVVSCCVVMDSQTTMGIYHYSKESDNETAGNLHVDIVNANEYEAEQVLAGESFPCIDRSLDADGNLVKGIRPDSDQSVHLVIFGLTQMGRAFATTAANLMHYPNFKGGEHRSRITFVGEHIRKAMDDFISRYEVMFRMSHSTYIHFDEDDGPIVHTTEPDAAYVDCLDIEWQFIDAHPSSPYVRRFLKECCEDKKQTLNIAVCYGSSSENTAIALHLPKEVYDSQRKIPIFIHIRDFNEVIEKAHATGQYGALHPFGAASTLESDPLFEKRSELGKRINYIYNQLGVKQGWQPRSYASPEEAWYSEDCAEWSKLSSIYSGIATYGKARCFPSALTGTLTDAEIDALCELEHRRWTTASFLLGYTAPDKAETAYLVDLRETDKGSFNKEKKQLKKKYHHWDMIPFDSLSKGDKDKDYVIINNMRYILGKADAIDLSDRPARTDEK